MRKYVTKTGPAKTGPAGPFATAMFMFCMAYRCYTVACVHSGMYIHNICNTISMCLRVCMCSGQGMDVHVCLDCEEDTRASKHGY